METLWQDVKYGLRSLKNKPAFTLLAVFTLALGIGANTAIFSVVNSVLLSPLLYKDSNRLITFRSNQSPLDVADLKSRNQSFEEIGGITYQPLDYTGGAEPQQIMTGQVTAGYFKTLGVEPLMGRVISTEDRQGGEPVLVLSYELWQSQFNGDPQIINKEIPLAGKVYTIIGVMPKNFVSPRERVEAFAPVNVANPLAAAYRGVHFLRTYAKLAKGVSIEQAQAEMQIIDQQFAAEYPEENKTRQTVLFPLQERIVGNSRTPLLIIFGAVALVLLIACANFANLLLTRSAEREREMVIRSALGANRLRIIRQLLTESVLIALGGGALGIILAIWGIDLLVSLKPDDLPRLNEIRVDRVALLFTLGLSVITGLVFGLIPAWNASGNNLNDSLKEGGRTATGGFGKQRLRSTLVIAEIAIAMVLLIGAGLLIKSFSQLRAVRPGFNPENVTTMRIDLPETRYKEIARQNQFRSRMLEEVNAIPGVQAALVSELPLGTDLLTHNFIIEGRPPVAVGEEPELLTRSIEGEYFRAMQIALLSGRDFTAQDTDKAPLVGVVNESFVNEFFDGESPLGARVRWARDREVNWITIVGVVSDVKYFGLNQPEQSALYTPYAQSGREWKRWMNLVVRSQSASANLIQDVKTKVWKVDPLIPLNRVRPMTEIVSTSLAGERFNTLMLTIFAVVALLLAVSGIYGVIAYLVTQRTHEIGIRLALGAQLRDVFKLVIGQGLLLTIIGVGIGLLAAFALTRLLQTLLFGVSASDPLTFTMIAGLLFLVAILACYLPARRASKVDPMIALRYE
ncbi:MAG: ABC transporter permease [Acidobacteriota bacterium]